MNPVKHNCRPSGDQWNANMQPIRKPFSIYIYILLFLLQWEKVFKNKVTERLSFEQLVSHQPRSQKASLLEIQQACHHIMSLQSQGIIHYFMHHVMQLYFFLP